MPRKGENIYKRKDGRWEGRYIGCYDENHKAKYVYIYGKTYTEVKQKLAIERGRQKQHVPAEKKQITYGEVLDLWLHSTKTSIKESTSAILPLTKVNVGYLASSFKRNSFSATS